MQASFVIGFHTARMDNLLQTLRFLELYHSNLIERSQLITVCQDAVEDGDEFRKACGAFHMAEHYDLRLECMKLPVVTNFALDKCQSDRIIILESDRILPVGYFWEALEGVAPKRSVTCKSMKKLLEPASDDEIIAGNFKFKDESRSDQNQVGVRNMWSGNTVIWKPDFYEAGRMDESYVGYGWADSDMTNRMHRIGVEDVFLEHVELHLHHAPATYGNGDQKQMFIDNGLHYCKTWGVTVPDWLRTEIKQHRKVFL